LRRLDEKDVAIQELQSKLLALEAECFEKQNDCDRHEQALWNLQSVLEQFQAEQDARIKSELRTIQNELDLARSHSSNLEKEMEELRVSYMDYHYSSPSLLLSPSVLLSCNSPFLF
jgi:chromosome segregation ATPase